MNPSPADTSSWPTDIASGPLLPSGRVRPVQIQIAATSLAEIHDHGRPADRVLQQYFRAHHGLGRKDRGRIQSLVYFCLRHWRLLDWLLDEPSDADRDPNRLSHRLGAALWLGGHLDPVLASSIELDTATQEQMHERRALDWQTIPRGARLSLTDDALERLDAAFGADSERVAEALNRQAAVMLRINPLKTDREQLQTELTQAGIHTEPVEGLPLALRLEGTAALTRTEAWRNGLFEIQDVGSQHIVAACAAKPGQHLLDLCAGAGGKALALAADMRNQGQILACDVAAERLQRLTPRMQRNGFHNIETLAIRDSEDEALQARGPFDTVLIDAPCSGSGTWRRHPELKQATIPLDELTATQHQLLNDGARLTRPGGHLVYATCSLWRDENEDQIAGFLSEHPGWQLCPSPEQLDGLARLRPDLDDSDGFFYAVLQAPEPQQD